MKRIKDPVSGHVLIRFTTRQGDQQRQRQEQGGKGKATPSDADRGTVTFSISTDNGEMVFNTSYRFLHLPTDGQHRSLIIVGAVVAMSFLCGGIEVNVKEITPRSIKAEWADTGFIIYCAPVLILLGHLA